MHHQHNHKKKWAGIIVVILAGFLFFSQKEPVEPVPQKEKKCGESAGSFCILRDDFAKDSAREVRGFVPKEGGVLEIETAEGYRVTLNMPSGAVTAQQITLAPLTKNPFPPEIASDMKGTGVSVGPQYINLSGRYFFRPAWLVFDLSPEERKGNRKKPFTHCRPDLSYFDIPQCLNEKNADFSHDDMFAMTIDTKGRMNAKLVPVYKIDEDVYALAVLNEGIYVPRIFSRNQSEQMLETVELTAASKRMEASSFLEALRALEYFNLQPGAAMKEKLGEPAKMSYMSVMEYALGVELGTKFGAAGIEELHKKIAFNPRSPASWREYFSSMSVAKRTYADSPRMPDLFTEEIRKSLTDYYYSKPAARKIETVEAFNELWRFKKWHESSGNQPASVSFILDLFVGRAYAQDPDWPQKYWDDVRKNLDELINGTDRYDDLLILAGLAFEWESEDFADKALDKAAKGLGDAIDKAKAPDGSEPECDLTRKNLKNYGINECSDAAGNLLDLARKASMIEEDGLANRALKKAGLL